MSQEKCTAVTSNIDTLEIGDLEYGVGPSGSSEAVVGLACFGIAGVVLLLKAL
jgi:hypothetical protein